MLLCCIILSSSGKSNTSSRGSKNNFWRRCWGGLRKVKSRFGLPTTSHLWHRCRGVCAKVNIPSTHHNPYLPHYIICHLPLVFLFPTSPLSFYSPSLYPPSLSLSLFASFCPFAFCLLVCWIACLSRWLKIILNCVTLPIPTTMILLAL